MITTRTTFTTHKNRYISPCETISFSSISWFSAQKIIDTDYSNNNKKAHAARLTLFWVCDAPDHSKSKLCNQSLLNLQLRQVVRPLVNLFVILHCLLFSCWSDDTVVFPTTSFWSCRCVVSRLPFARPAPRAIHKTCFSACEKLYF